jgi:hypothetical protein
MSSVDLVGLTRIIAKRMMKKEELCTALMSIYLSMVVSIALIEAEEV